MSKTALTIKNGFPSLVAGLFAMALGFALPSTDAMANDHSGQTENTLYPSTPREFAVLYGAASTAMSAESVASFYGDVVVSIGSTGAMRQMNGNAQQRAELDTFFTALKERGITSLNLTDYTTTQLSNVFALVRLRWELGGLGGTAKNAIMSIYLIRLEEPGWRVVGILEMGAPQAP